MTGEDGKYQANSWAMHGLENRGFVMENSGNVDGLPLESLRCLGWLAGQKFWPDLLL
jgi:hypothetical protein